MATMRSRRTSILAISKQPRRINGWAEAIIGKATPDHIANPGNATPNLLLYTASNFSP